MSAAIDDAGATERGPVLVALALQGGGCHECGGAGGRMVEGRGRRRSDRARYLLAACLTRSRLQPPETLSPGASDGPLDARYIASIPRHRSDVARILALRPQPHGFQPASADTGRKHRFRAPR